MTEKTKIFYNIKKKKYFTKNDLKCFGCENIIKVGMALLSFSKKKREICFFCEKCYKKIMVDKYRAINECFYFSTVKKIPDGSFLINIYNTIRLKDCKGGFSVFEPEKITEGNTTDNTVYAGKSSYKNAIIGNPDYKTLEELDNNFNTTQDGINYLNNLKNATPVLFESDKPLIEDKKK